MLREFHHLALRDTADQVQMQSALPFLGLRIRRGTRERVSDQRESGEASTRQS